MRTARTALTAAGCAAILVIAGCDDIPRVPEPKYEVNQAKRVEMFKLCMDSLPAGPQTTKYNDWDEVVGECGYQAYYLALECVANCKSTERRP